eukprot:459214-Pleurochrysis_carterae.AAC.1
MNKQDRFSHEWHGQGPTYFSYNAMGLKDCIPQFDRGRPAAGLWDAFPVALLAIKRNHALCRPPHCHRGTHFPLAAFALHITFYSAKDDMEYKKAKATTEEYERQGNSRRI